MDHRNPDLKKAFEAAVRSGNTVMEGSDLEDFFQISVTDIHSQVSTFVEFAVRCANTGDSVGMEEVARHLGNLAALTENINLQVNAMRKAMDDLDDARKRTSDAQKRVTRCSEGLVKFISDELGETIETQ